MTPAHATRLVELVERTTGLRVYLSASELAYDPRNAQIRVRVDRDSVGDGVEEMLHELCHWLVAAAPERELHDYGLRFTPMEGTTKIEDRRELMACLLEAFIYRQAGKVLPDPSAAATELSGAFHFYWECPRPVVVQTRRALIRALRHPEVLAEAIQLLEDCP